MAKRTLPLTFLLDRSNEPFSAGLFQVTVQTKAWKRLGFVTIFIRATDPQRHSEIGHRPKTGLYQRSTSDSITCLLSFSSFRLFSFTKLNKLQRNHLQGRLSTTSRIMPSAEEENSHSGSSGISGPVPTLDKQPFSLRRPPSAALINTFNAL